MKNLVKRLLRAENYSEDAEVSVLLTDDARIAEINKQYRGIDAPTDVLAFSLKEDDDAADEEQYLLLGDVVISVETARRQAEERGHTTDDEIDVLLAHGVLHLIGYDHAEPEEAKTMFAKQEAAVMKGS